MILCIGQLWHFRIWRILTGTDFNLDQPNCECLCYSMSVFTTTMYGKNLILKYFINDIMYSMNLKFELIPYSGCGVINEVWLEGWILIWTKLISLQPTLQVCITHSSGSHQPTLQVPVNPLFRFRPTHSSDSRQPTLQIPANPLFRFLTITL